MCKSILNTLRIKDKNLNFSDEVIEKNIKDDELVLLCRAHLSTYIVKIVQLK